jgi:hypothetical protein
MTDVNMTTKDLELGNCGTIVITDVHGLVPFCNILFCSFFTGFPERL